jgi:hypothetical protein
VKPVFQTRANFVDGNCFAAAVASILELDEIPGIDPRPLGASEEELDKWREEWGAWFAARGLRWYAYSWHCPQCNWKNAESEQLTEYAIASVTVNGDGGGHAIVFHRGVPVHDPLPGSPFLKLSPEEQRSYPITAFTCILPVGSPGPDLPEAA